MNTNFCCTLLESAVIFENTIDQIKGFSGKIWYTIGNKTIRYCPFCGVKVLL